MTEETKVLAIFVRLARERRGLSKREFARRLGVVPGTIRRWENTGVVPAYRFAQLEQVLGFRTGHIERALDTTLERLRGGKSD